MNNALLLAVGMFTGMLAENPAKRKKTIEFGKSIISKINKVVDAKNEPVQSEKQPTESN